MGRKLSFDQLCRLRRLRKARRLWKKQPLFAYLYMSMEYPGYSYQEFLDDLRRRSKPIKRKVKNDMFRYGRYARIRSLINRYERTGNPDDALAAMRLVRVLRKPYRVLIRIGNEYIEYRFEAFIPIDDIEGLCTSLQKCLTETQADEIVNAFRKAHRGI